MKPEVFDIYEINLKSGGTLALSRQPANPRDLHRVSQWRPDVIVTMTTQAEFPIGVELPQEFRQITKDWKHLPIQDYGTPEPKDRSKFDSALLDLNQALSDGSRVLIHCMGGKGRSGMMVLRLMIMQGEAPDQALARLRKIRAGAVETEDQLLWATKAS